ncbi:nuclear transport factor 2 family protein [uncultured Sphingomonas sp.]|uniref:nuclear transport factor 2 family protein n=1 Tax=uncultured Sphingomonas sp. TaxID=158754 RepID=UPI002602E9AE|nr:nuclear transport factor 2 family protein [uncultured Sphingomonas sp.]
MNDISAAVIAAEKRRCDAMLANDAAALDAVLDARLRFSHATGAIDDKLAYLAKMAAGRIDYLSIDWSEEQVIALGDAAALLGGRMLTRVRVDGTEKTLDNRVLSAWARDGAEWRTVAFQSTPLKT